MKDNLYSKSLDDHPGLKSPAIYSPRISAQKINNHLLSSVDEVIEVINEQEKKNFKVGVFLLVIAISTWIIGLELVNTVLKGDEFSKPIFLAVLTGSCYIFNFIPTLMSALFCLLRSANRPSSSSSPLLSNSDLRISTQADTSYNIVQNSINHDDSESRFLSFREVLILAVQTSIIYFLYNFAVLSSLKYTSASNQTILGSTTTFFALCFGVLLKLDKFSSKKLLCVASSLIGVILINVGGDNYSEGGEGESQSQNTSYGIFLALIGAFCYTLFLFNIKLKCGTSDKTTNERQLYAWVGLSTFVLGIPVLFLADFLGVETFGLPSSSKILASIFINAVFSVVSDYATVLAMLLTSPLVTSLALTSSIPITIFLDFMISRSEQKQTPSSASRLFAYGFGVLCILVSVILININISSENELIKDVIDETLEAAIHDDEILSPMLSPYLSSSCQQTMPQNEIGIRLPISPKFNKWSKKIDIVRGSLNGVPEIYLADESQRVHNGESRRNMNHSSLLYTDNTHEPNVAGTNEEIFSLILTGGVNHKFELHNNVQRSE